MTLSKVSKDINYKDLLYKYKLLSNLINNIPDVIYFKDKKGRLIMVNKAHAKGLGLKPEEVIGKTDFDIFPKERAKAMTRDDMYVMRTGKPIIDKIERATRPDGADNYVSTTKIPRQDEKGRVIGLMGITRDITRRMQFERLREERARFEKKLKELEELNKIKSEFISIVSHELRTPLAIVKEMINLIFDNTAGPINDKQKGLLSRAKDNIDRLKHIIDELLDISRIESGRLKLRYSLVNLNDLIKDSAEFFKKLAQDKDINLDYSLPRSSINLFIDAERINQILSNLINNAIKFTEEDGEIKVEVEVLESKVRIGIKDTGIGISKQDLPKLFSRFTQVSGVPGAERKGVGLGLSIVKELIEKHGGEIWVGSRLGVGSKFYFTLPRFYTVNVLDNRIRDKINHLLEKDISVYLINVLMVNYKAFKQRIKIGPKKLFEDLKSIIDTIFKEKSPIVLADTYNGECSVIFSETTEKESAKLYKSLKDKIQGYFQKNKVENVFINLSTSPYLDKIQSQMAQHFVTNIGIKKIFIGAEERHYKRVYYKTNIEIFLPRNKTEIFETVDISGGGVCFLSHNLQRTNARIKIRLEFPKKKSIHPKGRVAWIKNMEELSKEGANVYKVGLEFIDLKNKDKKILTQLIK